MPVSDTNIPKAKTRITYLQVGPLAMITNLGELHPELWVPAFNYVLDEQNPYLVDAPCDHYEETNSIGPLVKQEVQHPMLELAKPPAP